MSLTNFSTDEQEEGVTSSGGGTKHAGHFCVLLSLGKPTRDSKGSCNYGSLELLYAMLLSLQWSREGIISTLENKGH